MAMSLTDGNVAINVAPSISVPDGEANDDELSNQRDERSITALINRSQQERQRIMGQQESAEHAIANASAIMAN